MKRAAVALACLLAVPAGCASPSWVELRGERFRVELADTSEARARGLMFRESLPADEGMLFVYPDSRPRAFWMKNTRIALDILFFDAQRRLVNARTAEPCRSEPCPTYTSRGPAQYVLELNAGTARKIGVEPGDALSFAPGLP